MLAYEIRRLGWSLSTFCDKKIIIFIILAVMQLLLFCHYAFATMVTRIFLQTLEEGCRTLVFFLTMNFFIKMSSKLMRNRQRWLNLYSALWKVAILLFFAVELYVVIKVSKNQLTDETVCDNSSYTIE